MSYSLARKWRGNDNLEYSDMIYLTDRANTIEEFKEFELNILRELGGLVYLPGLESLWEKALQLDREMKRIVRERFVTDHVRFEKILDEELAN
jgi:hypothetical protein